MEYGQYSIFELAAIYPIPLCSLAWPRRCFEAQWNKPWHGLARAELLDVIDELISAGDIFLRDDKGRAANLSRSELSVEFESRDLHSGRVYYGLTSQGGLRWERFSQADWSRYHSWEWDDHDVLEIAATTSEAAERAFRYAGPWEELRIFSETVERRKLQPWLATYWKTFAHGYAIRFKCEYFDDCDEAINCHFPGLTDAQVRHAYSCVRQDYEFFAHWYLKHPDTPPMGPI